MKPGICFRSRKFKSHIIFIGQSYFFKTNNTYQFSHIGLGDVGELLDGGAIKQKRSDLKDADQYTTPGTYFVNLWGGVWQNMPTNDCFGLFEVRSYDGYITQRLSAGNGKVFVRVKEDEKPFKPWPTAAQ